MTRHHEFHFHGLTLQALPSGALCCPDHNMVIAADLHLGRSLRSIRDGGLPLPPFDAVDTLDRLIRDLAKTGAERAVLLGDTFDAAHLRDHLPDNAQDRLDALTRMAQVVFVSGNHDPGDLPDMTLAGVALRHIAGHGPDISGHFHPKIRFAGTSFRAFLVSDRHLIVPAYGTFTGGMWWHEPPLRDLSAGGIAIALGPRPFPVPLDRLGTGKA